jgi:hypothetical protein
MRRRTHGVAVDTLVARVVLRSLRTGGRQFARARLANNSAPNAEGQVPRGPLTRGGKPRRRARHPHSAARSAGSASSSGSSSDPSTPAPGGCPPWRSSESRRCVADRGSGAGAGRRARALACSAGTVPTGPRFFCTWRPSGSRYFAYRIGPRARSTRKTWPVGTRTREIVRRPGDILGTFSDPPALPNHNRAISSSFTNAPGRI